MRRTGTAGELELHGACKGLSTHKGALKQRRTNSPRHSAATFSIPQQQHWVLKCSTCCMLQLTSNLSPLQAPVSGSGFITNTACFSGLILKDLYK